MPKTARTRMQSSRNIEELIAQRERDAEKILKEVETLRQRSEELRVYFTRGKEFADHWEERAREIGKRFRKVRLRMGFTHLEAAQMCGVSASQMSQAEAGKGRLSMKVALAFAEVNQVSLDWLLGLDYPPLPEREEFQDEEKGEEEHERAEV